MDAPLLVPVDAGGIDGRPQLCSRSKNSLEPCRFPQRLPPALILFSRGVPEIRPPLDHILESRLQTAARSWSSGEQRARPPAESRMQPSEVDRWHPHTLGPQRRHAPIFAPPRQEAVFPFPRVPLLSAIDSRAQNGEYCILELAAQGYPRIDLTDGSLQCAHASVPSGPRIRPPSLVDELRHLEVAKFYAAGKSLVEIELCTGTRASFS